MQRDQCSIIFFTTNISFFNVQQGRIGMPTRFLSAHAALMLIFYACRALKKTVL
jgi:hypothetical protein